MVGMACWEDMGGHWSVDIRSRQPCCLQSTVAEERKVVESSVLVYLFLSRVTRYHEAQARNAP